MFIMRFLTFYNVGKVRLRSVRFFPKDAAPACVANCNRKTSESESPCGGLRFWSAVANLARRVSSGKSKLRTDIPPAPSHGRCRSLVLYQAGGTSLLTRNASAFSIPCMNVLTRTARRASRWELTNHDGAIRSPHVYARAHPFGRHGVSRAETSNTASLPHRTLDFPAPSSAAHARRSWQRRQAGNRSGESVELKMSVIPMAGQITVTGQLLTDFGSDAGDVPTR